MPTIEDDVKQQLDPAMVGQMARQLGVPNDQVQKAVDVGIPLLLSALTRNASSPEGAQSLSDALARDHDGSVLQHKEEVVQNYQQSDGGAIRATSWATRRPRWRRPSPSRRAWTRGPC